MTAILEFDHVSFQRGPRTILNDICWRVQPGENWAILGLNRAGKTTMLKMIHGDIWPASGTISVLGERFGHANIPALKRQIGWVSTALQDWLHPGDLVEQIVLSGKFASIGIYEDYSDTDLTAAKQLLTDIGGAKLIGKTYRVLSQGERQLVLIARALMAHPKLLILDEPCNGLDLFARERLLAQVARIAKLPDAPTLLMVSHYTEELLPCFEHLLLLKHGEVQSTGRRRELLTAPRLSRFYGASVKLIDDANGRVIVYPANEMEEVENE